MVVILFDLYLPDPRFTFHILLPTVYIPTQLHTEDETMQATAIIFCNTTIMPQVTHIYHPYTNTLTLI